MITIIGLLGLCFGSFINALVWRIYAQENKTAQKKYKKVDTSILTGRSICPNCKHILHAKDLIPVLSWISLRGRCRYCQKKIHWQYPFVELLTAALFGASYAFWPYGFEALGTFQFISWLIVLVGFVALVVYDLRWMILPNRIVYVLIIVTLLQQIVSFVVLKDTSVLVSSFWGVMVSSGLFYVLFQISDGRWIGGGDVKLGVALGLLVGGPLPALLMLFIASLIGTVVSLPYILRSGKKNQKIPFGPLLIIGTTIVYFWGEHITQWYERLFLV